MLQACLVTDIDELAQILSLQEQNLPGNISKDEMQSQGFVTLRHDLQTLQQMHALSPSVIIKDSNEIVAYALTMLPECRVLVPHLEPMFDLLDGLNWNSRPLSTLHFYVMGQICVAKAYRGRGLVQMLYQHHKKIFQSKFDLFVTEISTRNLRSLRAHEKIGFKTIHTHRDQLDEWVVVAWDWKEFDSS
jgi:ribosomal protein S18 acetylase RimI-like enzyme